QVLQQDVRIEDPDDDLFAEGHRDRGDAQLDILVVEIGLDAPVLGTALLGQVHAREQLDARDDRGMQRLGNDVDVVHDPVDTETDEGLFALGLDVDVAGMLLEGVMQQEIYRRNDMLVIALDILLSLHLEELFQVAQVDDRARLGLGGHDRGPEAVEFAQDLEDVALGAEDAPDLQLAGAGQLT